MNRKTLLVPWLWRARLAAGVTCLLAPLQINAQGLPTTAWIRALPSMELGQGFFAGTNRGCVLITAGHLLKDADSVEWRTKDNLVGTGVVRFKRDDEIDIGIIQTANTTPANCTPLRSSSEMKESLKFATTAIHTVSQSGIPRFIYSNAIQGTPNLIARPHYQDEDIPVGTSGAPFYANSTAVGIAVNRPNGASRNQRNEISIQRLFDLPDEIAVWLLPPSSEVQSAKRWAPFDADQLPKDIRDVVLRARKVRKQAEEAASRAREVGLRSDQAAETGYARGNLQVPYGTIVTRNGDDYAGGTFKRVYPDSTITQRNGYGVLKTLSGDNAGRVIKCVAIQKLNGSCDGDGIVIYHTTSHLDRWEGRTCTYLACGIGILHYKDGARMFSDYLKNSPGVMVRTLENSTHQQRFEGEMIEGSWNGLGVIWNESDGSLEHIGQWEKNSFKTDRRQDLLRKK